MAFEESSMMRRVVERSSMVFEDWMLSVCNSAWYRSDHQRSSQERPLGKVEGVCHRLRASGVFELE